MEKGAPREKLIIGMPTYGRYFTLADPGSYGIGAATTWNNGFKSYHEVKQIFRTHVLHESSKPIFNFSENMIGTNLHQLYRNFCFLRIFYLHIVRPKVKYNLPRRCLMPATWYIYDNIYSKGNEPRCEKTGLRGFRPGPTQTRLYSYRRWLEA